MNITKDQMTEVTAALRGRSITHETQVCEDVDANNQIVRAYRVWVKFVDARTGNISKEMISSAEEVDAKLAAAKGSLKKAASLTRRAISVESHIGR